MHHIMDQNPMGIVGKGQIILYKAVEETDQKSDQKSHDTAENKAGTPLVRGNEGQA